MKQDESDVINVNALFDIRVESLANALLDRDAQYSLDQVIVEPMGNGRRRSGLDVEEVRRKHYDDEEVLLLKINRKGIFDTLPQGLFIDTDPSKYDTPKKRTRAVQQQTKDARKMFLPFEQAIFHSRITADRMEQGLTERFPDFVREIWGLDAFSDVLDQRQIFLLCYLLPEAQRVVGDWQLTEAVFAAVLRKPVTLKWTEPMVFKNPKQPAGREADMHLGFNIVLGDTFKDDSPTLEVHIKQVTYEQLNGYLPGGGKMNMIEKLLYSYFLPLEVNVVTKVFPTDDAWGSELDRVLLGYNLLLT